MKRIHSSILIMIVTTFLICCPIPGRLFWEQVYREGKLGRTDARHELSHPSPFQYKRQQNYMNALFLLIPGSTDVYVNIIKRSN